MLTWLLGATFLFIQINEYVHLGFSARDLAFGSIFYGLTGLHGAHVFVGLVLLSFATIRAFRGHFGPEAKDHLGVEVPGHLLALRRRHVDHRLTRHVFTSSEALRGAVERMSGMHNPLRSEADAVPWVVVSGGLAAVCGDRVDAA